jgi:hypothetical protein
MGLPKYMGLPNQAHGDGTMASDKQLSANTSNAKQSTGPRSQSGKARSRLNSRKHGLTAKTLVIGDEDPAQFEKLRAELMEEYDPQSALECELVERLSSLLWRLRRIPAFEAAIIDARRAEVESDVLKWLELKRRGLTEEALKVRALSDALIQDGDALGKLARHETTLMHAFTKTLQMLLLLQSNRRSNRGDALVIEPVALPPKA